MGDALSGKVAREAVRKGVSIDNRCGHPHRTKYFASVDPE